MSSLHLSTIYRNGQTWLSECSFTQPFKVCKPFYNKDKTQIMVMTATAGIMKDDFYNIRVHAGAGTKTEFTNQSYTKIFNTRDGFARQEQDILLEDNAELVWMMKPVIPFADSSFKSNTRILLGENSKLFYTDITGCGRVGMGEKFAFRQYHSRTVVWNKKGRMVFLDNLYLEPKKWKLEGMGGFEGKTHIGMIYLYGYEKPRLMKSEDVEATVTQAYEGYMVRLMGNGGEYLYEYAESLYRSY